jgi:hypothetical protein
VNSEPGSAVMLGTVRGAQVAVGRDLRAHVAWNAARGGRMLYARSDEDRTAFEPQRNLVTRSQNLDGGGSIATDRRGGVYVAWHGNAPGDDREESRRVWISRSVDDGATFAAEIAVSDPATGACACCALRLFAEPGGYLRLLYRSAAGAIHRDIYALLSRDRGRTFEAERLHPWEVATCPMSSMSFAGGPPTVQAWETDGQVFFNRVGTEGPIVSPPPAAGGAPMRRKHPRVAVNSDGLVMLTWAEGTGWSRGGSLGWQAFAPDGRALAAKGTLDGLPAWSFPAVVARRDGGFTLVY